MKVAYLLAPGRAQYTGTATGQRYTFSPWAEVDEADWPVMRARVVHVTGCCGRPARQMRVFGSEQEVSAGQLALTSQ